MALTAGRNTITVSGKTLVLKVKANTIIYEGSMVAIELGYAIPAKKVEGLVTAGRAEQYIDNTGLEGTNGAKTINVTRGVFKYENDTTDPVTEEDMLSNCYIFDDCTVTSLSTGTSVAGKVLGFSDNQVLVEII